MTQTPPAPKPGGETGKPPKVHAASFLASRTACGRVLSWLRLTDGAARVATHNGKPLPVSRLSKEVTCTNCWRASI